MKKYNYLFAADGKPKTDKEHDNRDYCNAKTLNGRSIPDGDRLRWLMSLESEDPYHLPAGEVDPEPRRYPPEPALDVPTIDDGELSLVEHSTRLSHETVLDYRLSRQLSATHQRQAKARRRYFLIQAGNWVAGIILVAFLCVVVASWLLGVNPLEWLP